MATLLLEPSNGGQITVTRSRGHPKPAGSLDQHWVARLRSAAGRVMHRQHDNHHYRCGREHSMMPASLARSRHEKAVGPIGWVLSCLLAAACADNLRHDAVINGARLTYCTSRTIQFGNVPVVYLHGGPGYNVYGFRKTAGAAFAAGASLVCCRE